MHHSLQLPLKRQIISCTAEKDAENFFDFRLVFFDTSKLNKPKRESSQSVELFKDSIYLNIGQIRVICLVKFVNELIQFIEPIVNPLPNLATQLKDQALAAADAVKIAYQETQAEGKQIFLDINLSSPLLIIPQNSTSLNGFLVLLGNLTVKNKFSKHVTEAETNTLDEIDMFLTDVEVKRIKYRKLEANVYTERESVVLPINFTATLIRTLNESKTLPELKFSLGLSNLDSSISLVTLKLLFAILDENLNEGIDQRQAEEEDVAQSRPNSWSSENLKVAKRQDMSGEGEEQILASSNNEKVSMELHVVLNQIILKIVELKSTGGSGSSVETVDFSLLKISKVDFNYYKRMNSSWDAYFKMRALHLNDTRPDSNLAVKE